MTDGYVISFLSLFVFICFVGMCGGAKNKKRTIEYQTVSCSTPKGWKTYEAKEDLLVGSGLWRFTTSNNQKIVATHCFLRSK